MRMYGIDMRINELEHWFLKRIISRMVVQSNHHQERISYLYEMIRNACRKEFNEDNDPTLDAFLQECFDDAKPNDPLTVYKWNQEMIKGMQALHRDRLSR